MDLEIKFTGEKKGKIIETAEITLSNGITIHGVKVIQGQKGAFVGMPSRKVGENWEDIITFRDKETAEAFKEPILKAYFGDQKKEEAEVPANVEAGNWGDFR